VFASDRLRRIERLAAVREKLTPGLAAQDLDALLDHYVHQLRVRHLDDRPRIGRRWLLGAAGFFYIATLGVATTAYLWAADPPQSYVALAIVATLGAIAFVLGVVAAVGEIQDFMTARRARRSA
jgi:hypothetical protein